MKNKIFTFVILLLSFSFLKESYAQADPLISTLVSEVNIDTLVKVVRAFSGEDSTYISSNNAIEKVLIRNRSTMVGRGLAADYLVHKLQEIGLTPITQNYGTGRNVYAIQEGIENPGTIYVICGHYDSVAEFCAEDNASGVSLVLEAARILSKNSFRNTIVYAFWDEEETGFKGSKVYAKWAADNDLNIAGVLNLETLAYDNNNNLACDIHSDGSAGSTALVNVLRNVKEDYDLSTNPGVFSSAPQTSDQVAFWSNGFSAVAFGGSLFSDPTDLNPYFHTSNDRIEHFNLDYFHEMGKHAIAAIATLAVPSMTTSTTENNHDYPISIVYPNPVHEFAILEFRGPSAASIRWNIFDKQARQVSFSGTTMDILNETRLRIPFGHLPQGTYFVRIYFNDQWIETHKILKMGH